MPAKPPVPYEVGCQLLIQEEGAVVLTGGQRGGEKGVTTYATKNVTRLNAFGETTSLPFLLVARQAHACGKFTNSDGNIVSGSGLIYTLEAV